METDEMLVLTGSASHLICQIGVRPGQPLHMMKDHMKISYQETEMAMVKGQQVITCCGKD